MADTSSCSNVTSIQDINDKFTYEDTAGGGSKDSLLVSCGQEGSYNELQYIYNTYMSPKISAGAFTKQAALTAMCKACFDISNPRYRSEYYLYLENALGTKIFP